MHGSMPQPTAISSRSPPSMAEHAHVSLFQPVVGESVVAHIFDLPALLHRSILMRAQTEARLPFEVPCLRW